MNPHIITFEHRVMDIVGSVVRVSCRCGLNGLWPNEMAAGDWARRHRIATGWLGKFLFRFER